MQLNIIEFQVPYHLQFRRPRTKNLNIKATKINCSIKLQYINLECTAFQKHNSLCP